ncbi:hypothetical protein [Luteimonas kalidii]|uniref:Asparagine synthetase domain-containing protein n=1 Tax=Luteimonas kalidii TaxID=3042025 RepID=A0ABT6JXK6_9GAMM|nr:hypothetical protein [Luteimonas kalidii]MDH5835435.1 hypothetical protein [Luteimonas kalidii]
MASRGLTSWLRRLGNVPQQGRRGSGLGMPVPGDIPQGLLYARGFLLTADRVEPPVAVAGWQVVQMPGYSLRVDARVPVQHAEHAGRSAWLVGDAFEPEAGIYQDAARYLLQGDLLERLDGMAGRFALFVLEPGRRLEVYHDAMGSRSIFYSDSDSDSGAVVASHAGLVADILGTGLREWIIPFITSRGYFRRDVKYLPGLDSPFEGVRQLTPNTRLVLPTKAVERYWPREPRIESDYESAVAALVQHVSGLGAYLRQHDEHAIVGVSAGRDSRCALAGVVPLSPSLFTFVRSPGGESEDSADSRIARRLAEACGLGLEIVKISTPPHLDIAKTGFAKAFRRNTGYVRGNTSGWVEHFWQQEQRPAVFVRGFGGEVMRGFYRAISSASPQHLANTYDVNSGTDYTIHAFRTFCQVASWDPELLMGRRLDDMLYWEHRMGVWGSSAFSESDMAFRGLPAFNSRNLFQKFMALPPDQRNSTKIFDAATTRLCPSFDGIPYSS